MHRFTSPLNNDTTHTLTAMDIDGTPSIRTVQSSISTHHQSYKNQAKRDAELADQVEMLQELGWIIEEDGSGVARLTSDLNDTRTLILTAVEVDGVACIHNEETSHQSGVQPYPTARKRDAELADQVEMLQEMGWIPLT